MQFSNPVQGSSHPLVVLVEDLVEVDVEDDEVVGVVVVMEIAIDSGVVVGVELVLVALVIVVVVVISFINWENKNLLP